MELLPLPLPASFLTKIYVLTEPDGEIRYVGKTGKTLHVRFSLHLSESRQGLKNHRCNWIRSVLSKGYLPTIQLIGEVEGNGCKEEIAWIAYGRAEGWRLVNETDGGEGALGCVFSDERIRKMSLAKKGKPLTKEHRENIGLALRGEKSSFYGKHLIGKDNPNFGKHPSKETLQKMSKITKQRLIQNGHPMSGKHHSAEALHKMSEAKQGEKHPNYGKHLSEETRRRIGLGNRGRVASKETRRKISDATKIQFATKGHPRWGRKI
ncbi:MAG: NUMOD3 domain-containing DNA-binding protein [Kiritimatiellia bacterium]|nr:NUMOD3 domain-containing DNA-binding protein [Kiritimatiellia bacterium]